MHEEPTQPLVAALVETIDARTSTQTDFIMSALVRGAWPGGVSDRVEPRAHESVRRSGPGSLMPAAIGDCACAVGRCGVCN